MLNISIMDVNNKARKPMIKKSEGKEELGECA